MNPHEMKAPPQDREVPLRTVDLTDDDIYSAMKSIPGYLDITAGDFKELYCYAYQQAVERIGRSIRARDLMEREVVTVRPDAPLHEVAEVMANRGISGVPVVDQDNRVMGVISEKDFLTRMGDPRPKNFMAVIASCLKAKGCIALPIRAKSAQDIMSSPAITVGEDTPLGEIAQLMAQRAINRVPVTDGEGRLVGIITRNDLIASSVGSPSCSALISSR